MMRAARPSDPRRLLIVNPFGIGDVLFTTPLIRAVRQAFPRSDVAYLCNRRTEPILRKNPHLNELYVYEKDDLVRLWRASWWKGAHAFFAFLRRIRRSRFDLVIDLSLGERYSFFLALFGVPRRIGFDYRTRGRFLTERLAIDGYHEIHIVEYYRRLLRFMGITLVEASLELPVSVDDERWADRWLEERQLGRGQLLVGVIPAGGASWGVHAPFRRWHSEGFAAVANALAERHDAQIILFGEASDAPVCRTVARLMARPPSELVGVTTLEQFVSLLSRLDLVICNDGGPLHLAVSQRVRTVSIFGPVDPRVYGPHPFAAGHRVICRQDLPCRPCYRRFRLPPCPYERACLTTIEPDEVIQACDEALSEARAARDSRMAAG